MISVLKNEYNYGFSRLVSKRNQAAIFTEGVIF